MKKESSYKVISLFSGIGGLDLGFSGEVIVHHDSVRDPECIERSAPVKDFVALKRQPFEVIFQNDVEERAKEIVSLNGSAANYRTQCIRELLDGDDPLPNADVVIGGIPCKSFSHAGKREGFASDSGTLYRSFVEVVRRVEPKVFVAENVYGLVTMKTHPLRQIVREFTEVGYDVSYQVIKCEEFGIPQRRTRVIIMGVAKTRTKPLPSDWNTITKNRVQCSVGKYFAHLGEPADSDDMSHRAYSRARRLPRGQGQSLVPMDGFAPTIRAEHHGNIEFRNEERRLSVREAALLQTFPPAFVFSRNSTGYKFIGNAVPPLLGYLIADKVKDLLNFFS